MAVASPFDAELAKLGTKVGGTYLAYGAGGGFAGGGGGTGGAGGMAGASAFRASKAASAAKLEAKVVAAAPAAAAADRAFNKAINSDAYDENDLIQGVENGSVKLDALKKEELPDELQKLSPDDRKKFVAKKIEERKALRERIVELSKKRDAFLQEERKKQAGGKATGFDEAVNAALKEQVARKAPKP